MANVWVATELGSLRAVDFKTQKNTVVTYDELDKKNEIVSISRSTKGNELYCTLALNLINVFDTAENIYVNQYEMEGPLVDGFDIDDAFISCSKNGQIYVWRDDEVCEKFKVGENTECCVKSLNKEIISGGRECELSVWDVENQKATFTSKNVPRDTLDIRMPVWIQSISTLKSDPNIFCVGTHYHQFRMYDKRVKRRPVVDIEWGELPIFSLTADDKHCYLSNGKGDVGRLDLRTGGSICKYRGAAGSVRGLALHSAEPYLASVGLDRYLRVHHTETRELVHKFYLKNRMNAVVFTEAVIKEEEEEEDVWKNLEEVNVKRRKLEAMWELQND